MTPGRTRPTLDRYSVELGEPRSSGRTSGIETIPSRGESQASGQRAEPRQWGERCVVCGRWAGTSVESAIVSSNVRAFSQERFAVWRCPHCGSIHARDSVDLDRYYSGYPFFQLVDDWRLRTVYSEQIRRLEREGLRRGQCVLDYGSGSGAFVRQLRRNGYGNVVGYDAYSEEFRDEAVLGMLYDCVVCQDVLEHVNDPGALLDQLVGCVRPGGLLALGTPNASAIDLCRAEDYRHALHLPYHRHILSKRALIDAAELRGLGVLSYYPTQYANTRLPFLNSEFYRFYMRSQDDTLDCLLEPPAVGAMIARLPKALHLGILGSESAEETDVMVMLRAPGVAAFR